MFNGFSLLSDETWWSDMAVVTSQPFDAAIPSREEFFRFGMGSGVDGLGNRVEIILRFHIEFRNIGNRDSQAFRAHGSAEIPEVYRWHSHCIDSIATAPGAPTRFL